MALFRIGQVTVWALRAVRRRALLSAAVIIAFAAFAIAPASPLLWSYRILFWCVAGFIALVGLGGIFAALCNEVLRRLQNTQEMAQRANGAKFAALALRLDHLTAAINSISIRSEEVSRKLSVIICRLARVEEMAQVPESTERFKDLVRPVWEQDQNGSINTLEGQVKVLINECNAQQQRLAGEFAVLAELLAQNQRRVEDLGLRAAAL